MVDWSGGTAYLHHAFINPDLMSTLSWGCLLLSIQLPWLMQLLFWPVPATLSIVAVHWRLFHCLSVQQDA